MSLPQDHSWPAVAAELAFNLAGLILLWRWVRPGRFRDQPPLLSAWDIPLSDFCLFLLLGAAGGFGLGSGTATLLKHTALDSDTRLLLGGAAMETGVLGGAAVFYFGFSRTRPPPPGESRSAWVTGAATFLICLPVLNLVSLAWQELLQLAGLPVEKQDMVDLLENTHSPVARLLLILLASVGAPLMEEIIFRAGLFRYLRTRLPRWAALLIPAVLFGAAHWNLAFFAPLTLLGLIFSLAYERTGRIGTTIVAHGLFNLNTIVMVLAGFAS